MLAMIHKKKIGGGGGGSGTVTGRKRKQSANNGGESTARAKINQMLSELGESKPDWMHLVKDTLSEESVKVARGTLRRFESRRSLIQKQPVLVYGMRARNDLARIPFKNPALFDVGQWHDDPDQDETITLKKTVSYVDIGKTHEFF